MKHSFALALLVCAPLLHATSVLNFTNGQAAKAVFGQQSFSFEQTTASDQIVGGVSGLAWANGTLYVAEGNLIGALPINNRVVVFPTNFPEIQDPRATPTNPSGDGYCPLCGYRASTVIGQIDSVSTTAGHAAVPASNAAGSLSNPAAVATDGTLFAIADTRNNRVLIWNTIPSSGTVPPNVILGQPDFTTLQQVGAVTASTLITPQGVWIQNGKLFVADTGESRVLVWNRIPTSNNQAADVVLGQANFQSNVVPPLTTSSPPTAANQMLNPTSVSSDGTHLFVADFGFNRVLIWNSIPTQNDQPADLVIGQADLTKAIANNTSALCASNGTDSNKNPTYPGDCAKTLDHPRAVLSDGTRLFVADSGNDRVLIYNQIPTSNTAAADIVLGQPDFTSDVINNQTQSSIGTTIDNTGSVDTTPTPMGLAFDGTNLYVSDAFNRRVLLFAPGDISIGQKNIKNTASKIIQQEGFVVLSGKIVAKDTVTVTIQGTAYTYTVVASDTLSSISNSLVDTINGKIGGGKPDPNVTAHAGAIPNTVFLSSTGTNNAFDSITLAATTSNATDIVATASGGYLIGGNSGTAAPGTLVEIDNPNLDTNGNVIPGLELADFTAAANTQIAVPAILKDSNSQASVQVFMDGNAVPVLSASPTQLVVQVPFEYTNRNSTSVYVRRVHANGTVSVTIASPLILAPANPGLFSIPGTTEPRPAFHAMHAGNPSATISIDGTPQAGDSVQISVNGRTYSYTVLAADSLASIASNLATAINNGGDPQVTAQRGGAFARVVLIAKQAGAAGSGIPVSGKVTAASGKTSALETVTAYTSSTCCSASGTGLVSVANPAQPNEVITLLATGLGIVLDSSGTAIAVPTGAPYKGVQPNSSATGVNATVSGATGQVIGAGLAPGGIGVYNVQVLMPSTLAASGVAPVYIAQNAFISNTVTIPIGTPGPLPINLFIDQPASNAELNGGTITAFGWAVDKSSAITDVSVSIDGNNYGSAASASRPDVCKAYPASVGCGPGSPANVGWTIQINTNNLPRGSHTLSVVATDANGNQNTASRRFSLNNPVRTFIDAFEQGSTVSGTIPLFGWAISTAAAINRVTLSIDGNPLGNTAASARPDVCNAYPLAVDCSNGNVNVGWNLGFDTSTIANGTHTLAVTATDATGQHGTFSAKFTVNNAVPAGMKVFIDTPGFPTSVVVGTTTLSGWAISQGSPVTSVSISVDNALQGTVVPAISRADVCVPYPASAGCPSGINIGWSSSLDTTLLTNGTHILAVTGFSNGRNYTATKSFTVANGTTINPIRLTIDSPNAQAGPVSGVIYPSGWSISDEAAILNVSISVDAVSYGNVNYGVSRRDVCNAFPNRLGCPNVGWNAQFDTTLVPDGTHTLTATATAANGQRFSYSIMFTVANRSTSPLDMFIDSDLSKPVTGALQVVGWAGANNSPVTGVTILVDGMSYGSTTDTLSRSDVCAAHPNLVGCPQAILGWSFSLDTTQLPPGAHILEARAITQAGAQLTVANPFTVGSQVSSALRINLESPAAAGSTLVGTAQIRGWAVDNNGQLGSATISIDGVRYSGTVTYVSRGDVCTAFSLPGQCPHVGWSLLLDTTQFADGPHRLDVTATSAGQNLTLSRSFTIGNWTNLNPVQIGIDSATVEGVTLASSPLINTQTITGFAGSNNGSVSQVAISIDGLPQPQLATYGVTRPGGCAVFGSIDCPHIGWTYSLDTTLLPNGVHILDVTATTLGQNTTVSTSFSVAN